MVDVVLMTPEQDVESVLPGLALLTLNVNIVPLTTSALAANLDAPALILDGRRDLVSARALCRAATGPLDAPPILLVLEEGGFAVVAASWGATDTVLFCAPPAEIQARLRIIQEIATARPSSEPPSFIEAAGISIDGDAFAVRVGGQNLDLTYKEFELLRFLAAHPKQVLSRETLLEEVWGSDYYGGSRTVDVHIRRLRAKLGPQYDSVISTVRNVGYRFDV